ncbi:MAG: protoporphyrinogen oxidase [Acidobacteriales bacterium]|nr:protoporphyrinogen oxidase [Terriglobales bacterium]
MKRIAIVGGGISGLSAAFSLEQRRRRGEALEYTLFESGDRLGGVIRSERVDGCLVEAGPDSFLTEKPWAADLCRQLGISDQLVGSNDALRKTYILLNGKLVPMPDGLMFMVPTRILPVIMSPLFSWTTKLRMAREWFSRPRAGADDESVASFIERHYGREMVRRLADPLLYGVYGGEATELSVRAVLGRWVDIERTHGSLGRAMVASRRKTAHAAYKRSLFTSLKDGMQGIVEALASRLPVSSVSLKKPVDAIQRFDDGWKVLAASGAYHFDALIAAVPAHVAGSLLEAADTALARELREIRGSSSVTVTMGFDSATRSVLPRGFGFLVPRGEGKRVVACTFVHDKFPGRTANEYALLRCFLGGTRDPGTLDISGEEILRVVCDELRQVLGVMAEPRFVRIYRYKNAMAQYGVGHLDKIERIGRLALQLPGLALAGNGYHGIGVPDCIRSGQQAADRVCAGLGLHQQQAQQMSV